MSMSNAQVDPAIHGPTGSARTRATSPRTSNGAGVERRGRSEKRCACGLTYASAAWGELPSLGVMTYAGEAFELRNCACGSTLCVKLAD